MLQTEDLFKADIPQSLESLEYMSMVSHMRIQVFQEKGCFLNLSVYVPKEPIYKCTFLFVSITLFPS
jgi:hypothetical protein